MDKRRGTSPGADHVSPADQQRFAAYAGDMASALARVARSNKLDTLAYLFDMARLEAQNAAGEAWDDPSELN